MSLPDLLVLYTTPLPPVKKIKISIAKIDFQLYVFLSMWKSNLDKMLLPLVSLDTHMFNNTSEECIVHILECWIYRHKSYLHLHLFMTGNGPFKLMCKILTRIVQSKTNGGNI